MELPMYALFARKPSIMIRDKVKVCKQYALFARKPSIMIRDSFGNLALCDKLI